MGIRFVVTGEDIEADGDGAGGSMHWVWIRLGGISGMDGYNSRGFGICGYLTHSGWVKSEK